MTLGPFIISGISLALLLVGIGLLILPLKAESSFDSSMTANSKDVAARHFRHLAQLRRILTHDDRPFIDQRLSAGNAHRLRLERKAALRKYIVGIGEDFACLDHLAREIASLSPKVEHGHETERLYLEFRFRVLYRLALLRLGAAGSLPFEAVAHLSEIVGSLSRQVEGMMAALQPLTPEESAGRSFLP